MTLTNWRDLSIVLLALEAIIIGLVPAVAFFYAIKGMRWAMRNLRIFAPSAQYYFRKAEQTTRLASDRLVAPFIAASATTAQVKGWRQVFMSSSRSTREV